MSKKVQGIILQIGGDTSGLAQAFKTADTEAGKLQTQLKEVGKALKYDPNNVTLISQKQRLLSNEISTTKDKITAMKQAQEQYKNSGGDLNSASYTTLTTEISKAEVKLKSLRKEVNHLPASLQVLNSHLSNIGGKLKSAGQSMMRVTGIIAAGAAASVKLASDDEEATNKVAVAFGKSSKKVEEFSATTLKTYGIAKGTSLDMAAKFGDMGTSMGQTTGTAAKMSTTLVGLAGDMASFKNISVEQASSALTGIYTGQGKSLKSLGVVMTDTRVAQYATEHGFKGVWKQASDAEKVQWRYKYVLDATKNSHGDFARTSGSTANQLRMSKEAVKELGANIGEKLLPYIAKILSYVNFLITRFQALSPAQQKIILMVVGVIAAIGPLLITIGNLMTAISTVSTFIGGLSMTILGPIAAIAAVIAVIILLYAKCEWFRNLVNPIIQFIANIVITYIGTIITTMTKIFTFIGNLIMHIDKLPQYMSTLPGKIGGFISKMLYFFAMLPARMYLYLLQCIAKLGSWIISMAAKGASGIGKVCTSIINGFKGLPGKLGEIGSNLVKGLWNGIGNMASWIHDKISGFGKSVVNSLKSFFGIHSPSKLMEVEVGAYLPQGVAVGVEANTDSATSSIQSMGKKLISTAKSIDFGTISYAINGNAKDGTLTTQVKNSLELQSNGISQAIETGLSNAKINVNNNFDGITTTVSKQLAYQGKRG